MEEKEISVRTRDGEMIAFAVHPEGGGPFPVALLFMDGVGYREQIKENARRFAAGGYYVAAPDLYYRMGDRLSFDMSKFGPEMTGPEADRLRAAALAMSPDGVLADTQALLSAIADDPAAAPGPRVAVGYCMGARVSLHVAAELADVFAAAAGIHPGALLTDKPDSPHHDLAKVRGELYFAFAENDRTATVENIDQFRDELRRNGVRGEVERLPGTTHGFAMQDLPMYDREAAERHFERTLGLWRRNLRTS
jgi:carboxymethylenebutenolidase